MRRVLASVAAATTVLALMTPTGAVAQPEAEEIPGLQQRAVVVRDSDGIPHIYARNMHDLLFMQGWVHAEDRLFQMDFFRRTASGTLAELVGPAALGSDVELRTLGLRRAAERSIPLLSDAARAEVEAYAAGINAWVAAHPLPPEYGALELTTFEPWTGVDSAVISKLFAFSLSFDLDIGLTEIFLTYVGAGGALGFDGAALFSEDLFRSAPFDPASTVPDATVAAPAANAPTANTRAADVASGAIDPAVLGLIADYRDRIDGIPLLEAALELDEAQGSNEWAVSGDHTANGRAIMANDPHLALDTPAVFYQNHLVVRGAGNADSVNAIGSSFAGAPYVILGQNRRIAWGATTNPMDVTDTYQEQVVPDPTSPSGLSTMYQGNPEPIIPIPVEFRANQLDGLPDNIAVVPPGGPIPPVVLIVPRRNNGPIVAIDPAAGFALSVQYTGFSGTRETETFRTWNMARSLDDFRAGLETFDVGSQNWAYTDVEGNIAYFVSAEMPLREDLQAGFVAGTPPWLIRNGTGGNEWLPVTTPQPGQAIPYEILPQDELPHLVNPPTGFFVNANNDPAGTTLDNDPLNQLRPGGGIYYLNPGYAIGTRAGRITDALTDKLAAGPVNRADMAEIQGDVVLLDAQVLTPYVTQAFANATASGARPALSALAADPRVAEAVERLAGWDHTTPTGVAEGYDFDDVDGVRTPPTAAEVDASIAATIYSVWRGQMIGNTIDATLAALGGLPAPGSGEAMKALRNLLDNHAATGGVGASGVDFFAVPGIPNADQRRDLIILQSLVDGLDLLAGPAFAPAFSGSTDQGDYRWGRLHRVVFDHPLGPPFDTPPAGGAFLPSFPDLPGVATDGGFGVVDASSHSARADDADDFMFGGGPVRRYVGGQGLGTRITGRSSLPGGESGVLGSPFYVNLLPEWLTNESHRHLTNLGEVIRDASSREVFEPARSR